MEAPCVNGNMYLRRTRDESGRRDSHRYGYLHRRLRGDRSAAVGRFGDADSGPSRGVGPVVSMADVFISFRSTDRSIVRTIAQGLAARGLDVWLDESDIYPGDLWREQISDGLKTVGAVVIVVGSTGIGRVQEFEVGLALDRAVLEPDLPIIPILLPDAVQSGKAWESIANRSYISVSGSISDEIFDRIAAAARGVRPVSLDPPVPSVRNPYPGLRALARGDADVYFGREKDIAIVKGLCETPGLVSLIGPSGLGKSSLMKAGVLPHFRAGIATEDWVTVVVTPDSDPVRSFLVSLSAVSSDRPDLPAGAAVAATTDPGTFLTHVLLALDRTPEDAGLVVALDQLEELFTVCADAKLREAYVENVVFLATRCPKRLRIIATLRSDYLRQMNAFPEFAALLAARHHLLAPMDEAGVREIIQRPAWTVGVQLQPTLVDEILSDVKLQPNALPLLAVALQEMWRHRQGDLLTLKAYVDGGRVTGALDALAEGAITPFLPEHEPMVRTTLLRLVSFAPDAPPTRRRRISAHLTKLADDPTRCAALLDRLATERLLVADAETVEFSHDALVVDWARLAGWVTTAGVDELVRQRIEGSAADWARSGKDRSNLANAGLMDEVQPLIDAGRLVLTADEREYVRQSNHAVARARQTRLWAIAVAIAAVVALVGVGFLLRRSAQQRAQNQVSTADRIAAQSLRLSRDHPDLALRLSTAALAFKNGPAVRGALVNALAQPAQYLGQWEPVADPITAATLPSPGSIVVGTQSGELAICEAASRACTRWVAPGAHPVRSISGSRVLAITFEGDTVDVAMPGEPLRELRTTEPSRVATIDRGGNLVASASASGMVELRSVTGRGGVIGRLNGLPQALAVSPNLNVVFGAS
jgi:TIR domain